MLLEFLNHAITISIVVMAVIILRWIFSDHISPGFRYALWFLVVLKLFIPFTFIDSGVSLTTTESLFRVLLKPDSVGRLGCLPVYALIVEQISHSH